MSMAIASDADETSTGSSGNPVENEDRNMLADSSGSNQVDCTVHHYYEKLKDFAFDMPAGWTDATISLFIDTFKLYKDDFSRPHPDELKIWQKIVKRCVERSNNHKVFTVNSVMELAGSLKSHVLRNEYRKNDETFKMLYDDVVDIIPYFPNTTCDSVSQNLRLRSRTHEAKAFVSPTASDSSSSKNTNVDNLILNYFEENSVQKMKYCSNSGWNNLSKKITASYGVRVDLKKYLGDMKRKAWKNYKVEPDPNKRKTIFETVVGAFEPYFDLMPPRTIKRDDFFEKPTQPVNSISEESSDDLMETLKELQKSEPPQVDGPRVYKRATPKKIKPDNFKLESFPIFKKIIGVDACQSSDSDEPTKKQRNPLKKQSLTQSEDLSSDSVTSPEPFEGNEEGTKEAAVNLISPRKRSSSEMLSSMTKNQLKGRSLRNLPSSEDDSSPLRGNRSKTLKRPLSEVAKMSKGSLKKNVVFGCQNPKSTKVSKNEQNIIFKTHAKVELCPLKMGAAVSNAERSSKQGKKVDKVNRNNSITDPKSKITNSSPDSVSETADNASPMSVGESHHDVKNCSDTPITHERIKSKNIVTPINVKINEHLRQEPSASTSSSDVLYSKGDNNVQPRPSNSLVSQEFGRLERMEDSTVRLIEGYKEKVKSGSNSVIKLIPKQQMAVTPVGVSNSASVNELAGLPLSLSKPPGWFDAFVTDFRKHEIWKMHQIVKLQQELVDMENRKIGVLEKILTSLNDKKS